MPTRAPMKKKSARDLLAMVNAHLKQEAVVMGNDKKLEVSMMPTGFLPIDILLLGGIPTGRMVQLHGDYSTLKSAIGLYAIGSVQRNGGTAALIDTEHAYDPEWAATCGVDTDALIVWPNRDDDIEDHTGEEAIDIAQLLTAEGCDLIVFDSVAAALPQAEAGKRLKGENIQPARLAQLMSSGLRRLTAVNNRTGFIFINQTRLNIGITFGSNEALPGGKALPFYASYIVSIRKVGKTTRSIKVHNGEKWVDSKELTAQTFKAELQKSKLSKPFREVYFSWNLDTGQVDIPGFLISQGLELGIINVKGNSWSYRKVKAVGRENFKNKIAASPQALLELEKDVRLHHGLSAPSMTDTSTRPLAMAGGVSAAKSTGRTLSRGKRLTKR